eukprot:5301926-Prymnesium_polylepis.1
MRRRHRRRLSRGARPAGERVRGGEKASVARGEPGGGGDGAHQRHVVVVRPGVVAPADVHAHPLGRDRRDGLVHHPDVRRRDLLEVGEAHVTEARVAAHREVGAVDLQREAGGGDRLVLRLHRRAERLHVLGVVVEVIVVEKVGQRAGRRRREEDALCGHALGLAGGDDARNLLLQVGEAGGGVRDRPAARRVLHLRLLGEGQQALAALKPGERAVGERGAL